MSDHQEPRDDSAPAASVAAAPLWNGWAMGMFFGLLMVIAMAGFFFTQSYLFSQLTATNAEIARQQHYIAVRTTCLERELVPAVCRLRAQHGLGVRPDVPCDQVVVSPPDTRRYCEHRDIVPDASATGGAPAGP